jgi:hypothetical protein
MPNIDLALVVCNEEEDREKAIGVFLSSQSGGGRTNHFERPRW